MVESVVKVNLKELAMEILDELPISIDENGLLEVIGDFDFFTNLIDQHVSHVTPDKMIIKTGAYKDLVDELMYFIGQEILTRMNLWREKLDGDENKILINEEKEYECELDGN